MTQIFFLGGNFFVGWASEEVLRQSRSRKDVKNKILQTFNISSGDASRPVSMRRDASWKEGTR